MIIGSTGVKGGVGKSTFAVLLALKISKKKKVVLCDLDVECPNDFLLLDQKLKKKGNVYQDFPVLVKKNCEKCGICANVCREGAIFWKKGEYPVFLHDLCSGCGACWLVCPNNAIKRKKRVCGEWFVNKINKNLWLITGRSKPGITETGPVVRRIKEKALEFAKQKGIDNIIIDTAAGTHCSVIQALMGSDKIFAVTEPTPLGEHDLKLMLQLSKKLGIKTKIVINKSDIGNKQKIKELSRKFDSEISYEIPYSEELVRAYCEKDLSRVDLL